VNLSGNAGKWGFFASGTRQATTSGGSGGRGHRCHRQITDIRNYANHGNDLFGFGKPSMPRRITTS